MRELTYFVAVSLDGYIAGPGGEFDAFLAEGDHMAAIWEHYAGTAPTQLAEAAGLSVENGPFDTVVMGRNTYDVGLPYLPSPYQHLLQIVFTGSPDRPEGSEAVAFTDADPAATVRALKEGDGGGIWLCGGGVPLFGSAGYAPRRWSPTSTQAFASGVIFAEYSRG